MKEFVEITESKLINNISTSTKGNQNKWFDNNFWYKSDGLGYESLSEYLISSLLKYTNVQNYVNYDLVNLKYKNNYSVACRSANFLNEGKLFTLKKLLNLGYNMDIYEELKKYSSVKDKINYIVNSIEKLTGIPNFGQYLTTMLEIDAFFLNEDRHLNNISVIRKENGAFTLCPLYDFGASLFSDTFNDYPLEKSYDKCIRVIHAKPFSENFDEQCEAAEQLYGVQFEFNFSMKEVDEILENAKEYYDEKTISRVRETVSAQLHKYKVYQNDKLKIKDNFDEKQM